MNPVVRRLPTRLAVTDTSPVQAGAGFGWVSGSIANLAASATATIMFDLGADWDQITLLLVMVNPVVPSSGLSSLQLFGNDVPAVNTRRLTGAYSSNGTIFLSMTTAAGPQGIYVRPAGRYLIMQATNNDATNAMGHPAQSPWLPTAVSEP